jgi:hypothetical protein
MIHTQSNRMTMTKLLTRRLLHGDIETTKENGRVFVPYDSLVISRNRDGGLCIDLVSGKAVLASIDVPNMPSTDTYVINRLEGRMEVQVEQERADFHRMKDWLF